MAAPKLTNEQRAVLLTWLAAEYTGSLIRKWFQDREWPPPTDAALSYYRDRWDAAITTARTERRTSALNTGLALKEERIKRLAEHADELEAIKWQPDEHGRLWNEKAWRETLDDIAKEMGHRRQGIDVNDVTDYADVTPDERIARLLGELDRLTTFAAWERATPRLTDAEPIVADDPEA
jgi:hypothetical protein